MLQRPGQAVPTYPPERLEFVAGRAASIGERADVVLVAQSLGGFTAPLACTMIPEAHSSPVARGSPFCNHRGMSVLVVVGGLPATGKSTVAACLARRIKAPYLRVDRIEQAIVDWSSLTHPVGPAGYAVAHHIAAEQLALGLDVVVECVNPLALTRNAWVETGRSSGALVLEVELICSDAAEHKRRVETRVSDVEGLVKPAWNDVRGREYEPWSRPHLVLDTANTPVEEAVGRIATEIESLTLRPRS